MIRRPLIVALVLALLAVVANAELGGQTVTATATAQTVTVSGNTVLIVNDDTANSIYVRVFNSLETPADATTSSPEIKFGEGFSYSSTMGIKAVSVVCAATKTASVRFHYW